MIGTPVGVFVNGEVLLPHAPSAGHRLNAAYPIDTILEGILEIGGTPAVHVHERVIARNWSDRNISAERSFIVGGIQRHLFQMLHVPVESLGWVDHASYFNGTGEELDASLERRAANWAARTLDEHPEAEVHVVFVGLEPPELPDGVIAHTVHVSNLGNTKPVLVLEDDHRILNTRRKLWIPPLPRK